MADAPRVLGGRGELLGDELLLAIHIPEPELDLDLAAVHEGLAGHQRLGLDLLPAGEVRRLLEIADLLDEGRRIERREIAGTPEIVGDDTADGAAGFFRPAAHQERRDGNRQRIDAPIDDNARDGMRQRAAQQCQAHDDKGMSKFWCSESTGKSYHSGFAVSNLGT